MFLTIFYSFIVFIINVINSIAAIYFIIPKIIHRNYDEKKQPISNNEIPTNEMTDKTIDDIVPQNNERNLYIDVLLYILIVVMLVIIGVIIYLFCKV